jgi:hypothetical protein
MANKKISELDSVSVAGTSDELAIVVGGITKNITATNLKLEGIRRAEHTIFDVTSSQTVNLSTTTSVNVILVKNPGLTITIQFPSSPLEAQVCEFTTLTNTVNIIAGSGAFNPIYSGAPTAGFKATYVYHDADSTWYLIG